MTRLEELERIIIGSILDECEDDGYMDACRICITEDMFTDERHRRIYKAACDIYSSERPYVGMWSILKYDGTLYDIVPYMCELCTEWCFRHKKTRHNERQWLLWYGYGKKPEYTYVEFDDYVARFADLAYKRTA